MHEAAFGREVHCVQGLLWGAYADPDVEARQCARSALQRLPLHLQYIEPLLRGLAAAGQAAPPPTARKRGRGNRHNGTASAAAAPLALTLSGALSCSCAGCISLGHALDPLVGQARQGKLDPHPYVCGMETVTQSM
jgi:hypothetical protein